MPMSRTGWKDHFAEQIGDGPDGTTINLKKQMAKGQAFVD